MLFDSHAHYSDAKFDDDRWELIARMREDGVEYVIEGGVDVDGWGLVREISTRDGMFSTFGVHPHYAAERAGTNYLEVLREYLKDGKCVAIGEIGLDYFYDNPKEPQKQVFVEQLDLAIELDMPVVLHIREAHADGLEILKRYKDKGLRGTVHCYSGSAEMVKDYVDCGMYFGFDGPITFEKAKRNVESALAVPLDRLLIETDSPYMTPTPLRGKRNQPPYVKYIAEKIAQIRGMEYDEIVKVTSDNAKKLFQIK